MANVLVPCEELRAMSQAERDRLRRALDVIEAGGDPGDVLAEDAGAAPRVTRPKVVPDLTRRDRR